MTICLCYPTCSCYSPDAPTCQAGGGSHCGRWKLFETQRAMQTAEFNRELARIELRKKRKDKLRGMLFSSMILLMLVACSMLISLLGEHPAVVMVLVVFSGVYMVWFIESLEEWS